MAPRSVRPSPARRRRRRGRAGAVLVEAIVVIIMLMLIFAGLIFAQSYYSMRLRSMRSARAAGAALALYGCDRGMTANDALAAADLRGLDLGAPEALPLPELKPETDSTSAEANASLEDASSRTSSLFPKAVRLRARGSVSVNDVTGGSALGGRAQSTTYLLCNDEPEDGDVTLILPIIAKFSFL